ncbi:MAG TPA: 50S ribosomal protein L18 [Candidatus Gracilibacteria bacterium]|nr:50S ribosomal protein L18 [Candidatus Gracilibacteria bacterium]
MKTSKKVIDREKRHNRIRTKMDGTAKVPRLVVYKSLNFNYAQLIDDATGKTLVNASDMKDKSKSTKTEKAKKVGIELAKLALEKSIKACVFDRNGFKYHGRIKAVAEGAREGGLKF